MLLFLTAEVGGVLCVLRRIVCTYAYRVYLDVLCALTTNTCLLPEHIESTNTYLLPARIAYANTCLLHARHCTYCEHLYMFCIVRSTYQNLGTNFS